MDYRFLSWGFTTLFVYLKLVGHVDWSWWLVLSPLIVGFIISFFVVSRKLMQNLKRVRK